MPCLEILIVILRLTGAAILLHIFNFRLIFLQLPKLLMFGISGYARNKDKKSQKFSKIESSAVHVLKLSTLKRELKTE